MILLQISPMSISHWYSTICMNVIPLAGSADQKKDEDMGKYNHVDRLHHRGKSQFCVHHEISQLNEVSVRVDTAV